MPLEYPKPRTVQSSLNTKNETVQQQKLTEDFIVKHMLEAEIASNLQSNFFIVKKKKYKN